MYRFKADINENAKNKNVVLVLKTFKTFKGTMMHFFLN